MPLITAAMWTSDDAISLIRVAQPFAVHAGYHLGLAGGVLNRGASNHDLDIIVMPLADETKDRSLKGLWRAFELLGVSVIEITLGYPMERGRTIWRGHLAGKQIDFFVYEKLPRAERIKRWWRRGFAKWLGNAPHDGSTKIVVRDAVRL